MRRSGARAGALAAAALLLVAASEPVPTLAQCAAIDDTAARLACYDRVAGRPAPAVPPAAATFGKPPAAPAPQEAESLRARLVGPFQGWQRNTTFRLDNGQAWRVTEDDTAYYPGIPDNPAVTITRNWFGAYWMQVEGVGRRVKVKRLS